ncbi:MAG TPA: hypothetical protein VFF17_00935 [Thermoanaerobaculia bacterium]|nr:hypothetical protein [Thermoanaerobaculia bacterium]
MSKIGPAVLLAVLIGAVPTIVSLCELRCVAAEVAPVSAAPSHCAGHGAEPGSQPSQSAHEGCGGHVLLAKGGAAGTALHLDLAVPAVPVSGSFVLTLDRKPVRVIPESADLSPPPGGSSDILRL